MPLPQVVGLALRRSKLGYLVVGSGTAGMVDAMMQAATEPNHDMDVRRSLQMVACGALINGIYLPNWFHFLNRRFGERVAPKVILDQLFFAPLAALTWIAAGAVADARETCAWDTSKAVAERLGERLLPVWAFDCFFWVPWNWSNFRFIPAPYRPYYSYIGNAVFVGFVSIYTHGEQQPEPALDLDLTTPQNISAAAAAAKKAAAAAAATVEMEVPPQLGAQRCAPAMGWRWGNRRTDDSDGSGGLLRRLTTRCAPAFAEQSTVPTATDNPTADHTTTVR